MNALATYERAKVTRLNPRQQMEEAAAVFQAALRDYRAADEALRALMVEWKGAPWWRFFALRRLEKQVSEASRRCDELLKAASEAELNARRSVYQFEAWALAEVVSKVLFVPFMRRA